VRTFICWQENEKIIAQNKTLNQETLESGRIAPKPFQNWENGGGGAFS